MRLLLLLLLPCLVHAQLPTKDDKVFYEKIDTCSLTKDRLYNASKLWFVNAFNDSKAVLEIDDKEAGELIGKGFFSSRFTDSLIQGSFTYDCWFSVRIDVKESKYRIQIYDIKIQLQHINGVEDTKTPIESLANDSGLKSKIDQSIKIIISDFTSTVCKNDDSF